MFEDNKIYQAIKEYVLADNINIIGGDIDDVMRNIEFTIKFGGVEVGNGVENNKIKMVTKDDAYSITYTVR